MKFRYGIIGCGNIAGQYKISNKFNSSHYTHAGSFNKYFDPVICIDKNILKAKTFKKKWDFKTFSNKLNFLNKIEPTV